MFHLLLEDDRSQRDLFLRRLDQQFVVHLKDQPGAHIKGYLETYAGVKRYMEETIRSARETGYVKTLFGRRRYLPELVARDIRQHPQLDLRIVRVDQPPAFPRFEERPQAAALKAFRLTVMRCGRMAKNWMGGSSRFRKGFSNMREAGSTCRGSVLRRQPERIISCTGRTEQICGEFPVKGDPGRLDLVPVSKFVERLGAPNPKRLRCVKSCPRAKIRRI